MNINPAAAASIAGTARAAGRGGESDNQATEATRQQSTSESPTGKSSESTVDAGDQTQDRGGDGRQVLDVFEHSDQEDQQEETQEEDQQNRAAGASPDGSGENLDLQA
jgi:hypothetical protein